jgi:N-acetylglucosamine-6-phosphate deacetylase
MTDQKIYAASQIFTGESWLTDHAIISEDGLVKEIIPAIETRFVTNSFQTILPAFIDLQIYGAFGKLFSVYPEAETLRLIHQYCKEGGAYWFQPTVATNTTEVIHKCIDAVRAYQNTGGEGCLGLHIEGPWINKAKRGAHIESLVHSPTLEEARDLLEYGKGVISMITLAPEVCSNDVIKLIKSYGVVISAGHSDCTFEEANSAFNNGIDAVTHLYNAMSGLQHRQPGLVGATFLHHSAIASIIADGHHVDFAAIKVAQQMMGERLFLITDAVTDTTEGAYPHQKEGDKYVASGILSGSALTMMQSVKNMIQYVGSDKTEAIKMACITPAKVMGLKIGRIAEGSEAKFIVTDEELRFIVFLS